MLSATLADICDGEVLQLQAIGSLDLPLETYVEIARKKTASLFAASAQCGAIVGGGSEREIEALREFGECFGVAFQMKDDLLDMTSDERSLGKPAANDLTERKTTIPLIAALATAGDGAFARKCARFYAGGEQRRHSGHRARDRAHGGLGGDPRADPPFAQRAKAALEPIRPGAAKRELEKITDALAG